VALTKAYANTKVTKIVHFGIREKAYRTLLVRLSGSPDNRQPNGNTPVTGTMGGITLGRRPAPMADSEEGRTGWAVVAVLGSRGVTTLVLPAGQLFAMAGFAGLAGIVTAIAPSRRAARLDILRAVTTE
jgi:hypothetical protein